MRITLFIATAAAGIALPLGLAPLAQAAGDHRSCTEQHEQADAESHAYRDRDEAEDDGKRAMHEGEHPHSFSRGGHHHFGPRDPEEQARHEEYEAHKHERNEDRQAERDHAAERCEYRHGEHDTHRAEGYDHRLIHEGEHERHHHHAW